MCISFVSHSSGWFDPSDENIKIIFHSRTKFDKEFNRNFIHFSLILNLMNLIVHLGVVLLLCCGFWSDKWSSQCEIWMSFLKALKRAFTKASKYSIAFIDFSESSTQFYNNPQKSKMKWVYRGINPCHCCYFKCWFQIVRSSSSTHWLVFPKICIIFPSVH